MQKATKKHQTYPTIREEYTYAVGALAELIIACILEFYEFDVITHAVNANGTDIVIPKYDVGIEIWNHCKPHNYEEKTNAVINNLKPFKHKFLIATFISKQTKARLGTEGITVIVLGYQIMPNEFLPFYIGTKDTYGKKFSFEEICKILIIQLKPMVEQITDKQTIPTCTKRKTGANVFSIYLLSYLASKIQCKVADIDKIVSRFVLEWLRKKLKPLMSNSLFLLSIDSMLISQNKQHHLPILEIDVGTLDPP